MSRLRPFSMPRRVILSRRWIKHSDGIPTQGPSFPPRPGPLGGRVRPRELAVDGEVRRLRGDILHFTYRSIADHLARSTRSPIWRPEALNAQRKKCRLAHLLFVPPGRFIKTYILRRDFMTDFAGLVIAVLTAYGAFVPYAKLREIWKKGERIEPVSG
jgi:hypothetical protein